MRYNAKSPPCNITYKNKAMVLSVLIALLLLITNVTIFYEILRLVLWLISRNNFSLRPLMLISVAAIFSAHILSIMLYGVSYWLLVHKFGFHPLSGIDINDFFGYIYFSAETYTSLGFGDVYPSGAMRLIACVEVLNGLMVIGWSVIFSYFAIQKLWDVHRVILDARGEKLG